jgi:5'-3' exonuclease
VPNPLLVIDGPAVLYRAFFALPDSITDDDGHPVNALLGSVNQVLWCVEKYDPRAVIWCFGAEAGEYRVEAFPAYHADRPPMPDPLEWQWERAPQLYEALGWSVTTTPDLEADDLLHSFAAVETAAGGTTLILTGDRDMFQCANDSVTVLLQRTGGDGPQEVTPDVVREKYGVDPEQVPDFIALRGDPSDKLPGAKNVGAQGAANLLRRYGTLEALLKEGRFASQAKELRQYRAIATMDRKAPLPSLRDQTPTWDKAAALAREWGLNQLADRFAAMAETKDARGRG